MTAPGTGPTPIVSPRWRVTAVAIGAFTAALTLVTAWMTALNGLAPEEGLGEHIALSLAFYIYLVVGLILIARRPHNALGWVLAGIGFLTALGIFAEEYAAYGLAAGGRRAFGAVFAAWFSQWWWFPAITLVLVFVPLLYPTGGPPSRRWRWLVWLASATTVGTAVGASLAPVLAGDTYNIVNPVGINVVGDIEEGGIGNVLFFSMLVCMVMSLTSLVVRFRRSRGIERQQLKWFVYAVVIAVSIPMLEEIGPSGLIISSNVGFAIVIALPPVAMGIAVTRYRLYEIDRLISRTLTYAVLTAVLVGLYLVAVTTATRITAPVAGDSPVAVAAATLLAASAFAPARRRIQHLVDRRFNRARYDASRTLEAYRGTLRDQVELSSLTEDLLSAVQRTVAPIKTVVWLRDASPREMTR